MPQLTFPVTAIGLTMPVWIGLDGKTTTALLAAGQSITAPIQARSLIDTGTDVTAVSSWVLQRLALSPATATQTTTAAGPLRVRLYEVSLTITDPTVAGSATLTQPDLIVMELPASLPTVDVLIGLDVLLAVRFSLDGPAHRFTLVF